ncbi:MAG: hypothetical protein ACJ75H_15905 [Thermoanaerobaculia bacterium]
MRRLSLFLILLTTAGAASRAATLELVSRTDPAQASDSASGGFPATLGYNERSVSLSADGRFAVFLSDATNLVAGQRDVNDSPYAESGSADVFLKDFTTGAVSLVSHALTSPVATGNLGSSAATISADGRWAAFVSDAIDLAPGQERGSRIYRDHDVLLYDRVTGAVTLVAETHVDDSFVFKNLALSADGRYLAFESDAFDLVPGQKTNYNNIFLYDRVDRSTRLVSHIPNSPAEGSADGGGSQPGISADGRYVVFTAIGADLLPGQIPSDTETIVLYDRTTGALTKAGTGETATISSDGKTVAFTQGNTLWLYARETRTTTQVTTRAMGAGFNLGLTFQLSADGRYLAFIHSIDDFGIALYDRVSRSITFINRPLHRPGFLLVTVPRISANGRYVVYSSLDEALIPGQAEGNHDQGWDVFLYDASTGKNTLVSHKAATALTTGNAGSVPTALSANGSRIVYLSLASDLVAGLKDLNQSTDLYSYEVGSKATTLVTRRAAALPSQSPADDSHSGGLSADGRYAVFSSVSPSLIAGQVDTNKREDVFLYDAVARTTVLVSHTQPSALTTPAGQSAQPTISADGRWIAFFSDAKNLVPGAIPNGGFGLFLYERASGAVTFVGRIGFGFNPDDSDAAGLGFSADGRWLAFVSQESDIVPGQQEPEPFSNTRDVFLYDRTTGQTVLVSHSAAGPLTTGGFDSEAPAISADGRFIAFHSTAEHLVASQTGEPGNVFLHDRETGANTLVSRTKASPLAGSGGTGRPGLSGDGRFVLFSSRAGDLDPGVSPRGNFTYYVFDRALGTYQRAGYFSGGFRQQAAISADGRYLAFVSDDEILPGIYGGTDSQLYLYDRVSRSTVHVTRGAVNSISKGDPVLPRLSADGRYLAFLSDASDLIPGQIAPADREGYDLFLYDRTSGSLTLVDAWKGSSVTSPGSAFGQSLSASGRQIAFSSNVDLISDDRNRRADAYLYNLDPTTPPGPVTIPPCIALDTRRPTDAPAFRSGTARVVKATGVCGVPANARQILVKVTSLQPSGKGNLRFYPGDLSVPSTGILRFNAGQTVSSTFDLPVSPNGSGALTILPFVAGGGSVGGVVEIDGYTP